MMTVDLKNLRAAERPRSGGLITRTRLTKAKRENVERLARWIGIRLSSQNLHERIIREIG